MLNFACTIEQQDAERRQSNRRRLSAPVSVRNQLRGRENGLVKDLSIGGCAIIARGDYPLGSRVFVTIANFQPFAGAVVWHHGDEVGIRFDTPLHAAIVEHIASA